MKKRLLKKFEKISKSTYDALVSYNGFDFVRPFTAHDPRHDTYIVDEPSGEYEVDYTGKLIDGTMWSMNENCVYHFDRAQDAWVRD